MFGLGFSKEMFGCVLTVCLCVRLLLPPSDVGASVWSFF